jgi:predicted MFS family arabinose efflux permease
LRTAYSLETVFDEVSFIAGPPLSLILSVVVFPQAGLLAAAALLLGGVFSFVVQYRTEPPIEMKDSNTRSVIRQVNLRLLTFLMVAMGVIVGTVDIVSVALARQHEQPAAASLVLSAYAVGSCLAGLLFGSLKLRTPLNRLLLLGGFATAITTLLLLLVGSIPALATAVFIAGLFFAPTMIVAMALVENMVSESQLTEGMTWLLAGLNVGVAIGGTTSGQVVDRGGAHIGSGVAVCAGAVVLIVALLGSRRLRTHVSVSDE